MSAFCNYNENILIINTDKLNGAIGQILNNLINLAIFFKKHP